MKFLFKRKSLNLLTLLVFALGFNSNMFAGGGCFCSDPSTAPVLGAISGITTTTGTATWTAATHCGGITGYRVEVSLTSGGAPIATYPLDLGVVLTSGLIGLTCNTTYFVRVRGELNVACGAMFTAYSNIRSFTTAACGVPTCTDGVQNGLETGIDCGGTCPACVVGDCNDGIMNGTETAVDCGGTCPITCVTNIGVTTGSGACTGTELATIYSTNCDQVGTSAYNTNSPTIQAISTGGTAPPGITCGSSGGDLVWARYELDADVTSLIVAFQSGSIASGSSQTFVAVYNTNSACPVVGDYEGCAEVTSFASSIYSAYNARFDGLDPSKDVWLCFYNTGKSFNLIYDLIGIAAPDLPTNVSCGTASTAIGEGCNLGALGATFTTPGAAGVACGGGNWGSNENTVYYSFTADATSGSLEVDGIACNEGVTGNAQFGVWTSCAAIGTYGAGFLGCQVGTAPLSLSPLVDGQTYYIAVDGFAGDNCAWNFTGTGIILPIEYDYLSAEHFGDKVTVSWATASEKDNAYFTIQRTIDGRSYENVGQINGAGTSNERIEYTFDDNDPYYETSYYRVKQTDFDGKYKYSDIRVVNSKIEKLKLIPNPADAETKLNFNVRRAQDVNVKIVDITGMIVFEQNVQANKGMNNLSIDISSFGKGIYSVVLVSNDEVSTVKLSVY